MNFNWFGSVLVHHPFIILLGVAVFSCTCLIIPFTLKALPNFSDPQMGFQTRGTSLSNRITTWYNLVQESKENGLFTTNPKEFLYRKNITDENNLKNTNYFNKKNRRKGKVYSAKIIVEPSNVTDPSEQNWRDLRQLFHINRTDKKQGTPFEFPAMPKEGFFCGPPNNLDRDYAKLVVRSEKGEDLFNLESLLILCRIEQELIQTKHYEELCVKKPNQDKCCKPWSLANYIAALQNRTSCLAITEEDVNTTKSMLQECSRYFHRLKLTADCEKHTFCKVPLRCVRYNAAYNILNYITSTSFLPPNKTSDVILRESMIFIPLACSTAILPYYHELEKYKLDYGGISVVAMDFGIKSALFDEYLLRDTWLICFGGLFVLLCMWLYTGSLFLTVMTIIAIVFSLGISYFMYTLVFEMHFFPFMNLLTAIVAVGIGADDAFIFCKVWQTMKAKKDKTLVQIMNDTMHHAFVSMLVTSFTTSAAFFASYVSSITAIKCFSIFASISVLANCVLMVFWFPACIVIWERFPMSHVHVFRAFLNECMQRLCCGCQWSLTMAFHAKCDMIERFMLEQEKRFIDCLINYRVIWFVSLTSVAIASVFVVLYHPRLQLPNTEEFQLFDSTHMFEQYDLFYKQRFWFTKSERTELEVGVHAKMPLRFVWGVVPQDNGNYLEPQSLGTLKMDDSFNMSAPESQVWLLNFCRELRKQPFCQDEVGLLLPNCFMESFVMWMDRRCKDDFEGIDRTPCCDTSKFPYESWVFDKCVIEAIGELYDTIYFIPGIAGPKFSKNQTPTIKAVVIEYDSTFSYSLSFEYMQNFINQVEEWFAEQLKTAPASMKGGWFISSFEFYDLQRILSESTLIAIAVSMGLALIVLFLATLNIITSLYAVLNITCSIFVTMAILVLLGWKLNILESIAVSTAIGLTVDFSLHYTVNYRLAPPETAMNRKEATKYSLTHMLKPVTMAALTTGIAGAFMLPSTILAYIQIGTFLVTVMSISWLYATFHLASLLAMGGPHNNFGQCSYKELMCHLLSKRYFGRFGRKRPTESSMSDTHELDLLTNTKSQSNSSDPTPLEKPENDTKENSNNKPPAPGQSPSGNSAITIIMSEDP